MTTYPPCPENNEACFAAWIRAAADSQHISTDVFIELYTDAAANAVLSINEEPYPPHEAMYLVYRDGRLLRPAEAATQDRKGATFTRRLDRIMKQLLEERTKANGVHQAEDEDDVEDLLVPRKLFCTDTSCKGCCKE